ncbi:Gr93c family protein [Megaselia abdita]
MTTNFINRLCLKIIYSLYLIGKYFGIVTATYCPVENKVIRSKLLTKIFAGFRTAITFVLVIVTFAFSDYKYDPVSITFVLQSSLTFSTTLLLIVTQVKGANKLIELINEFISLQLELKSKKGVKQFFGNTFFVMLFFKVLTNTYLCFVDIPFMFTLPDALSMLMFSGQIFIWSGTLIFFNFAFIGLMCASAFQANMFEYLQNCWKLKEIDEYSELSLRFYKVYKQFLNAVRTHFLMAFIFYTLSIGSGLSLTITSGIENTWLFAHAFLYHSCCIVDVVLFNMAAELVERNSYKRNFSKVDLLTNDTKELDMLNSQMKTENFEIWLLGLFKMGNQLNLGFISAVITYVVYLVQFKNKNY